MDPLVQIYQVEKRKPTEEEAQKSFNVAKEAVFISVAQNIVVILVSMIVWSYQVVNFLSNYLDSDIALKIRRQQRISERKFQFSMYPNLMMIRLSMPS